VFGHCRWADLKEKNLIGKVAKNRKSIRIAKRKEKQEKNRGTVPNFPKEKDSE
jgi:hypothetical protein